MKFLSVMTVMVLFSFSVRAEKCPATIIASCLTEAESMGGCVDLASRTMPADQFKTSCTEGGGTYSKNACSKTGLIGSCIIPFGQQDGMITRFYAPITAEMIEMICTGMSGKSCN